MTFLKKESVMHTATCVDNKPSASVVMYTMDDAMNFYFITHSDSHKAVHVKTNSQISFSVWKYDEMLVQCDGNVELIEDDETRVEVIGKLSNVAANKESFLPPIFRIQGGAYEVFKITPTWMRSLDLKDQHADPDGQPFIEINL